MKVLIDSKKLFCIFFFQGFCQLKIFIQNVNDLCHPKAIFYVIHQIIKNLIKIILSIFLKKLSHLNKMWIIMLYFILVKIVYLIFIMGITEIFIPFFQYRRIRKIKTMPASVFKKIFYFFFSQIFM